MNETSNQEMSTISRAEYEKYQAQSKRVSELEKRIDIEKVNLSVILKIADALDYNAGDMMIL